MDYQIALWANDIYLWLARWAMSYYGHLFMALTIALVITGITPLSTQKEHTSIDAILVFIRKLLLYAIALMAFWALIMLCLFELTNVNNHPQSLQRFGDWLLTLIQPLQLMWVIAVTLVAKLIHLRYTQPTLSSIMRRWRHPRTREKQSDIRNNAVFLKKRAFSPKKYYKKDSLFIALDQHNRPIWVPMHTWRQTNMQIIGPTRYGKGVAIGCILDQAIRHGDAVVYIDPKKDAFIPQIMYQAAQETHRPFLYLTLHDEGIGYYAPFEGGNQRDALSRLLSALHLETTGESGTDYYKSIETQHVTRAFKQGRSLKSLLKQLADNKESSRTNAELAAWAEVHSLSPSARNQSFKMDKALKDGAIVYVQGKLDDPVVKTATKVFIRELIQESKRLVKERTHHLTVVVDEVSFLVSKTLAEALATSLSDHVNFVLAYQSINDLLNTDDKNLNPQYINQSINVNSQLKLVYGGKDYATAEWIAKQSGTIVKPVTRMEKTDVSLVGGESWERHRFISNVEENLIPTNLILSMPPGVACFVQPNELAKVAFTSFVPVNDTKALTIYLSQYKTVNETHQKTQTEATTNKKKQAMQAPNKQEPPPTTAVLPIFEETTQNESKTEQA